MEIVLTDLPNDILESLFIYLFNCERLSDILSLAITSKVLLESFNVVIHNQCQKDYAIFLWSYDNRNSKNILTDAVYQNRLDVVQKYFIGEKGIVQRIAMDSAQKGRLDIFKWLYNNSVNWNNMVTIDIYITVAAENGHLDFVKFLYEICEERNSNVFLYPIDHAAKNGHLDIVKWLHKREPHGCTTNAMDLAAENGYFNVVKWLCENRTEGCGVFTVVKAANNGHLEIVKYLIENKLGSPSSDVLYTAASRGYLEIVDYLYKKTNFHDPRNMSTAIAGGHLDIAKYLHENAIESEIKKYREIVYNQPTTYCEVAEKGRLDILEWLYGIGANIPTYVVDYAAKGGHLNIIKWFDEKWPKSSVPFSDNAMDWAASGGHFEILKWLYNRWKICEIITRPCTECALNMASKNCHFECVKFLHNIKAPHSHNAMDEAAKNGHIEIVKFLHENGYTCTKRALDWAIDSGHIDTVKFLYLNRTEGYTTPEYWIIGASRNGHLNCLKWLYENKREKGEWSYSIISDAIRRAATKGYLDVLKWLYDRLPKESDPSGVLIMTVKKNRLNVLKWLCENNYDSYDITLSDVRTQASNTGYAEIVRYIDKIREK